MKQKNNAELEILEISFLSIFPDLYHKMLLESLNIPLKEPSPILSTFFQTLGDFATKRKLIFFL